MPRKKKLEIPVFDSPIPMETPEEQMALDVRTVGLILREKRLEKNLSLGDVEKDICVLKSYLTAIEEGRYKDLPAPTYALGFVRSYAQFLGLDVPALIKQFKKEALTSSGVVLAGSNAKSSIPRSYEHDRSMPSFDTSGFKKYFSVVAVIVGCLIVGVLVGPHLTAKKQDVQTVTLSAPTMNPVVSAEVAPTPTTDEDAANNGGTLTANDLVVLQDSATPPMSIRAKQDTWVEVVSDRGETLINRILKAGESFVIPDQRGIKLTTGNAEGLEVIISGQVVSNFTKDGNVKKNFMLDDLRPPVQSLTATPSSSPVATPAPSKSSKKN